MALIKKMKSEKDKIYEVEGLGEDEVRKVKEAFDLFNKNKNEKLDLKDVTIPKLRSKLL